MLFYTPAVPAFRKLRQEDEEMKPSLGYTGNPRPSELHIVKACLKNEVENKEEDFVSPNPSASTSWMWEIADLCHYAWICLSAFIINLMCIWVYVTNVYMCACKGQKRVTSSGVGVSGNCELPGISVENVNQGPLEEQHTLLTSEPFFQPICLVLRKCLILQQASNS